MAVSARLASSWQGKEGIGIGGPATSGNVDLGVLVWCLDEDVGEGDGVVWVLGVPIAQDEVEVATQRAFQLTIDLTWRWGGEAMGM